jgi:predicted DNA-binding transcriptional regulator YafY
MAESAQALICQAIERQHMLSFAYKGERRTVEPYILGYDRKQVLVLSAVQHSGGSGKGFRSFQVDRLSLMTITDQKFFGDHPDYNPRDAYFERILCQVKSRE